MQIIKDIRSQLLSMADQQTKETSNKFFKEPVLVYGVKSALVQKLAKETFKKIKNLDKKEIYGLCEELFKSDYCEESFIACNRTYAIRKQYTESDFQIFQSWIEKYINNRAKCDTFCNHTMGEFMVQFPKYISELKNRTKSDNRRVKRASAVTFIIPAKKGKFLSDILEISNNLLLDPDDLVQKGYGRMLKAASQSHEKEVFDYVMQNKSIMPRTALRYAIEKMPKDLKSQAMKK